MKITPIRKTAQSKGVPLHLLDGSTIYIDVGVSHMGNWSRATKNLNSQHLSFQKYYNGFIARVWDETKTLHLETKIETDELALYEKEIHNAFKNIPEFPQIQHENPLEGVNVKDLKDILGVCDLSAPMKAIISYQDITKNGGYSCDFTGTRSEITKKARELTDILWNEMRRNGHTSYHLEVNGVYLNKDWQISPPATFTGKWLREHYLVVTPYCLQEVFNYILRHHPGDACTISKKEVLKYIKDNEVYRMSECGKVKEQRFKIK